MDLGRAASYPPLGVAEPLGSGYSLPLPVEDAPLPSHAGQPYANQHLPVTVVPMHSAGPYVIMHISHYLG